MSEGVWISGIMHDYMIGNKVGLRHKFKDEPWQQPYVRHVGPSTPAMRMESVFRHARGITLAREELPEASAVYDMRCFKRTVDLFAVGGFYAVKGRLADVLSRFDLGEGGGLVPYTIYEADETTPLPGPFFLLNFGSRKDSFLPEHSNAKSIEQRVVDPEIQRPIWSIKSWVADDDIALSAAALGGSDLWHETTIRSEMFMSDRLVEGLRSAGITIDFCLHRCRIMAE